MSLYILSKAVAADLVTSSMVGLGSRVLPNAMIPAGEVTCYSLTDLQSDAVVVVQYMCGPLAAKHSACAANNPAAPHKCASVLVVKTTSSFGYG